MHQKTTLLTFFLIFIHATTITTSTVAAGDDVSFHFPFFTPSNSSNITLIGDSFLRNGVVSLTTPTVSSTPSWSAGAMIFKTPITLFDSQTNTTSSFSTTFTFSITNPNNPTSFGDGLAFFLSPNNLSAPNSLSTSPGSLGLPTNYLAVEFDTRFNPLFNDPSENHVGIDVDTMDSIDTVDPVLHGIDLKSGNSITAWIDYKSDRNSLSIFLSYSGTKPLDPILTTNLDLEEFLRDREDSFFVGFSASAEGSTELHQIESWSFQTLGFVPVRPRLHTHNVSDNTVNVNSGSNNNNNNGNGNGNGNGISNHNHNGNGNGIHNSGSSSKRKLGIGVAVAGPVLFFLVFSVLGYVSVMKLKVLRKGIKKNFETGFVACPREFDYRDLKSATREFHPSRIVGHGSFGTVYKAFFISTGTIAAVKRSRHSHEGKTEFLSELSIIAGLRHKNLVQLQGWCVEKGELLLVYDFMPNGSLDKVLYKEPDRGKLLSWSHRVNIVVGLASVLVYLHQECEQRVIHRDIKTGNVLLDGNFNPRLGDFGLAKLMDHDKSPVSTLTAGTMGYLAPEYLQYGKATDKTDVFSYGVVVLEVTCGKRPIERDGTKMVNLVDWVWGLHSEGRINEAADKRLNGEFEEEEMRKLLMLGLSCANPDSSERPSMRRVLQILNNEVGPMVVPKVKPCLTFSSDLPVSIDEIVSEEEFDTSQSMCEIKIN